MVRSKTLYAVANVLTVSRFGFAAGLAWLVYSGCENTLVALLLFVLGELADAFDGILARKAMRRELNGDYENRQWKREQIERKRHFWVICDQVADILLFVATAFYCVWRFQLGSLWITVGIVFALIAIAVQIIRNREMRRMGNVSSGTLRLILLRRYFYLFLVAIMIIAMLWGSTLPIAAKIILVVIGVIIGLVLMKCKADRLTEDKTFV